MIKVRVGTDGSDSDLLLCPGQNIFTGSSKFIQLYGDINSLEEDLLNLAAGVYGADLAVKRQEREHYIRSIHLSVEVVNLHIFERVRTNIEQALFVISRDNWVLQFVQKEGVPITSLKWTNNEGAALLFSGGIDSMAGASEFIKENKNLVLVSHNSHANHVIDACQNNVHDALEDYYDKKIQHVHIKVYGRNQKKFRFPQDDLRENTQRTRSFLFLALAALVARRSLFNRVVYMAENGQFAIHLPLNSARIGPFSTHTADPEFVQIMESIFRILLSNSKFQITNPFIYKTKAEVFSLLPDRLKKKAELSASCWMISRVPGNKHCGYCIPCISRRIAIEHSGIKFKEYSVDIFKTDVSKLDDKDDKKRNLIDYLEFISRFNSINITNRHSLLGIFPELYNTSFDTDEVIELYKRVSAQSYKVLQAYPKIQKLLQ